MATEKIRPETCDLPSQRGSALLPVQEQCVVGEPVDGPALSPVAVDEVDKRQAFQTLITKEDVNLAASRVKSCCSQVSIKALSKKLRDAAGKIGKGNIVREIIQEAGNRFPEVSFRA
jgi:tRNA(Glu) U13 pseudouridine synthase TruD